MRHFYLVLIIFLLCSQAFAEINEKEVTKFFNKYTERAKEFDESLIELYSDSAKVTTNRVNKDGTIQKMELDGVKYKQLLKSLLELAKKRGDLSEFSDISITVDSERAEIRANRYSKLKCTEDPEYRMVIVPNGKNYSIIEEHTLTYAYSKCKNPNQLNLSNLLKTEEVRYKNYFGKMIDEDTRLDKVEAIGETLFWVSTLINIPASELDSDSFVGAMQPILIEQTCAMQNFYKILESNGIISYVYLSKEGKQITSIPILFEDCSQ